MFYQKCEIRMRKRGALPANSKWCEAKYDVLFVPNLMSDDEDEFDDAGERTGKFLTRAPMYRSLEVRDGILDLESVNSR